MYKLIIVEDEEIIRCGLREQVPWKDYGFEVIGEAENGKSALTIIPKLKPDVVLVDIVMPIMNGIEFIEELKKEYPNIEVVVLSGYSEFEYARHCIEYGAYAYLLKPTKSDEIEKTFLKIKNKLDSCRLESKELEMIKKSIETNFPLIKEKLISDLLKGNYTKEHKEEISISVYKEKINFESNYGVCLIDISHNSKNINIKKDINIKNKLVDLINNIFSNLEIECFDIVYEDTNILIIILNSHNYISEKFATKYIKMITEKFYEYFSQNSLQDMTISAGIGNFYDNIYKINDSYKEAKQALNYMFFRGKGCIIHVSDCNKSVALNNTKNDIDLLWSDKHGISRDIIHSTITCDKISLKSYIEEYFMMLAELKPDDKENIFVKTVEIMLLLSMKLSEKEIDFNDIYSKSIHDEIRKIIETGTLNELKNWMQNICVNIINYINKLTEINDKDPIIERAIKYISENYDRKVTLDEVCDYLYISPSHFCRLFKDKTGFTFIEYLSNYRISRAKDLLANTNMKIYEIAIMVGYDDFRYFSKVFKKFEGVNPVQYREAQ